MDAPKSRSWLENSGATGAVEADVLTYVLSNIDPSEALSSFLSSIFAEESWRFWRDAHLFKQAHSGGKPSHTIFVDAQAVYDRYIKEDGSHRVNIGPVQKALIKSAMEDPKMLDASVFGGAQHETFETMMVSLPKFKTHINSIIRSSWQLHNQRMSTSESAKHMFQMLYASEPDTKLMIHGSKYSKEKIFMSMGTTAEWFDQLSKLLNLYELGRHHAAFAGMRPRFYTPAAEAFLATLEKGLGKDWDKKTAEAWKAVMNVICTVMHEGTSLNRSPSTKSPGLFKGIGSPTIPARGSQHKQFVWDATNISKTGNVLFRRTPPGSPTLSPAKSTEDLSVFATMDIFGNDNLFKVLQETLRGMFAEENIMFYRQVDQYRRAYASCQLGDPEMVQRAHTLAEMYLTESSDYQVNIKSTSHSDIMKALKKPETIDHLLFDEAQTEVYAMMRGSMSKFKTVVNTLVVEAWNNFTKKHSNDQIIKAYYKHLYALVPGVKAVISGTKYDKAKIPFNIARTILDFDDFKKIKELFRLGAHHTTIPGMQVAYFEPATRALFLAVKEGLGTAMTSHQEAAWSGVATAVSGMMREGAMVAKEQEKSDLGWRGLAKFINDKYSLSLVKSLSMSSLGSNTNSLPHVTENPVMEPHQLVKCLCKRARHKFTGGRPLSSMFAALLPEDTIEFYHEVEQFKMRFPTITQQASMGEVHKTAKAMYKKYLVKYQVDIRGDTHKEITKAIYGSPENIKATLFDGAQKEAFDILVRGATSLSQTIIPIIESTWQTVRRVKGDQELARTFEKKLLLLAPDSNAVTTYELVAHTMLLGDSCTALDSLSKLPLLFNLGLKHARLSPTLTPQLLLCSTQAFHQTIIEAMGASKPTQETEAWGTVLSIMGSFMIEGLTVGQADPTAKAFEDGGSLDAFLDWFVFSQQKPPIASPTIKSVKSRELKMERKRSEGLIDVFSPLPALRTAKTANASSIALSDRTVLRLIATTPELFDVFTLFMESASDRQMLVFWRYVEDYRDRHQNREPGAKNMVAEALKIHSSCLDSSTNSLTVMWPLSNRNRRNLCDALDDPTKITHSVFDECQLDVTAPLQQELASFLARLKDELREVWDNLLAHYSINTLGDMFAERLYKITSGAEQVFHRTGALKDQVMSNILESLLRADTVPGMHDLHRIAINHSTYPAMQPAFFVAAVEALVQTVATAYGPNMDPSLLVAWKGTFTLVAHRKPIGLAPEVNERFMATTMANPPTQHAPTSPHSPSHGSSPLAFSRTASFTSTKSLSTTPTSPTSPTMKDPPSKLRRFLSIRIEKIRSKDPEMQGMADSGAGVNGVFLGVPQTDKLPNGCVIS